MGLRQLGHEVVHLAPYRAQPGPVSPHVVWIPIASPHSNLGFSPNAQDKMAQALEIIHTERGPFDLAILGRESFLWDLPILRQNHRNPVILICRGGAINRLADGKLAGTQEREQLLGFYRDCDRVVCIAQYLVDVVNQVAGITQSEHTQFIPNPVQLPDFSNRGQYRRSAPEETIRLLMSARMSSRKRPLDAVDIIHHLKTQDERVHLTICGDGAGMPALRERIKAEDLESNITLRGRLDRQDVLHLLGEVETVLLCSTSEGMPRALQEAIAAGKGIVAYDNPGSREVIESWAGQWPLGRLVPIGDTQAAAEAVLNLAQRFRDTDPLPHPKLPDRLEILRQYDALFHQVLTPAVKTPETSLTY